VTFDCCSLADFLEENSVKICAQSGAGWQAKLGIFKRLHEPKKGYFVLMGVGRIL
jgi:hypothetical protein